MREVGAFVIQKEVFTAARLNCKLTCPCHLADFICKKSCNVDYAAGNNIHLTCFNCPVAVAGFRRHNFVNFVFQKEFYSVLNGIFCHCPGSLIRACNSSRLSKQSSYSFFSNIRLQFAKLFLIDNLHSRNAVCSSTLIKLFDMLHISIRKTNNQRADIFIIKMKFLREFFIHCSAFNIEFCHQSSRYRVVTRMNNSRVGL